MPAFLTLENISKYYTSGQSVVMGLHNVNLEFSQGEFVAITGESGSGKSTLARVIAGILTYENGEMSVNGKPTSHYGQQDWEQYRSSRISFISQSYDILPGCTVLENVVSALILTGMDKKNARERAEQILAQVELSDKKKRRAAKLSSGQKQRLSIARALAKPAPILIADEPTGNLDSENSAKVIRLLADAAKERLVLMVTHDFNEAQEFATRRITIRDGAVDADVRLRQIVREQSVVGEDAEQSAASDQAQSAETAADQSAASGQAPPAKTAADQNAASDQVQSAKTATDLSATSARSQPAGIARDGNPAPGSARKKSRSLSRYTASLQASSRPVWSGIMLLFFALTAFALFAFAGTFVVNIDDSATRTYDNSAFRNGSKTRIVVAREDSADMTEEDYDALIALPYVERIETYGFLSDINCYYREGIDYEYHYESEMDNFGNPTGYVTVKFTLKDTNIFLQTIPYLAEGTRFLTAGRLPENMYEVVAVGDESRIGTELTFYIQNKKSWPVDAYVKVTATVVGVTDLGEHFYVDEQFGRVVTEEFLGLEAIIAPIYEVRSSNPYVTDDDPLDGRFLCSAFMESTLRNQILRLHQSKGWGDFNESMYYNREFPFNNANDPEKPVKLKLYGAHSSSYNNYYLVKPETFEQIVPDRVGGVVSLIITDYAYTDRVLSAVHRLGYPAVSPYRLGSTKQNEKLAAERLATLKICILASIAVFLLQILVLRAMFGMETAEFKLLANLGLRCRTAKRSIIWQAFAFTVGGQLLAFAAVAVFTRAGVKRIYDIVKYLPASYILLFMLIHLAAGLLAALWVQRYIGRQVYPSSLQYADLDMDEEEEP